MLQMLPAWFLSLPRVPSFNRAHDKRCLPIVQNADGSMNPRERLMAAHLDSNPPFGLSRSAPVAHDRNLCSVAQPPGLDTHVQGEPYLRLGLWHFLHALLRACLLPPGESLLWALCITLPSPSMPSYSKLKFGGEVES